MTSRSLAECYRIVAEAMNTSSASIPPVEPSSIAVTDDTFGNMGFDSLAFMEFCIAIHVETGVEITVGKVDELGSPGAVARYLSGIGA